MAQRLIRLVCEGCKTPYTPQPGELPPEVSVEELGQAYHGKGCRECRNTGYSGRVGIYELLVINERTRELVMNRANARQIAQAATESGDMSLLRDAGFEKVRAGVTTLSEVLRATKA
jgi:general secretion pathway protein E/type IV pilus assembly protein PilB